MTEKLHGLAFVHKNVAPLAKVIDDALAFMPKNTEKDLGLQPAYFYNLVACLEAMTDQHELLGRLRDKLPLVEVQALPPLQVVGGLALAAPVAATAVAPVASVAVATLVAAVATPTAVPAEAASEEVAEAVIEASQEVDVEPTPALIEAEVEPVVESQKLFDLPFMGNNFFS
jgi:hypothetical protein